MREPPLATIHEAILDSCRGRADVRRFARALVLVLVLVLASWGCKRETPEVGGADVQGERGDDVRCPEVLELHIDYPRSAIEVDRELATVLSQSLASVAGVEHVDATSIAGSATLRVELAAGIDPLAAMVAVRERLAAASLPRDATQPVIELRSAERAPLLLAVVRDDPPAAPIPPELAPSVLATLGAREREVLVAIDQQRLAAHGIALRAVVAALEEETHGVAARNSTGTASIAVVDPAVGNKVDVDRLESIAVGSTRDGTPVRLADIARLVDTRTDLPVALDRDGAVVVLVLAPSTRRETLDEMSGVRVLGPVTLPACEGASLEGLGTALTIAMPPGTDVARQEAVARGLIVTLSELDSGAIAIVGERGEWAGPTPSGGPRVTVLLPYGSEAAVLARIAAVPGLAVTELWGSATRSVALGGPDFERLDAATDELARAMRKAGFLAYVLDAGGDPELRIELDENGRRLGLDSATLALHVRAATEGIDLGSLRVRLQTEAIAETTIVASDGRSFPLASVATVERRAAPTAIRRRDGQFTRIVRTDAPDTALDRIIADLLASHASLTVTRP